MRKIILLTIFSFIIFAGGCGGEGEGLKTTGTVEAEEIRVVAEVGGTIKELFVEDGSVVPEGEEIARLSSPELEARKEQAEAELEAARARLAEAESGNWVQEIAAARQEVERISAEVESARSELVLQRNTLEKYRQLAEQGALGGHTLQVQESIAEKAKFKLNAAEASLEAARNKLDLLQEGVIRETIEQLRSKVDAARAAVKMHRHNLSETVISSPAAGTVLTCNYKEGEVVKPGAEIATLGDT